MKKRRAMRLRSAGGCDSAALTSARVATGLGKEPEPRLFSFNNPFGACPRCQGFGNTVDFDLNLVIPDKGLSLNDGAIDPWNRPEIAAMVYRSEEARG